MIRFILFWCLWVAVGSAQGVSISKSLDLQECYELAVMKSESLGLKESEIKIQEALYWQAISTAFPQVHAIATPKWEDQSYTANINKNSGTSTTSSKKIPTSDSFEGKITVTQPLFRGFKEFNAAGATKETRTAKNYELQRARQLLYNNVAESFFQVIQYEGDLALILDLEKTLSERVSEMEKWVKLGKSRPSELSSVKADLAEAKVTEQQTRSLLMASKELLSFFTGVPSSSLNIKAVAQQWSSSQLESYLKEIQYRPDYLAALADERASHKKVAAVQAEHMPSVDVSADYTFLQEPREKGDWQVLLTMDLPIFEGGLIEARIKEQKALLRQSQLRVEELKRTADQEIRTRFSNFNASSLERVKLKEWVALAEENYLFQKKDYQNGVVDQLQVMDSLRNWTQARRTYWGTLQKNQLDWVQLHVAAGIPVKK